MIRKDFPILNRKINGKNFIYLNSSATSQKPKIIIDSIKEFYENFNSNLHRGSDFLSGEVERIHEDSRKKIAQFINSDEDEIVFTKSCTEAINIIANGFPFKKGDKIILTIANHHSNFVPWKILEKNGVNIDVLNINNDGKINLDVEMLKGAKLLALTHLSNILGNISNIKKICEIAHEYGCLVLVDAAQSIGKMKIDVRDLDCDFLTFSGHKMFAINGVGVLYGKKKLLEMTKPLVYGGDMINSVTLEKIKLADSPRKFEGGTQNIAAIYSLSKAIDYTNKIGLENIEKYIQNLTDYALQEMKMRFDNISIYGKNQFTLISFSISGIHSHDVAEFLSSKGIAIRAGHMCCQPLMQRLKTNSVVRISFHIYNDKKDIDFFIKELNNCIEFFKLNGK